MTDTMSNTNGDAPTFAGQVTKPPSKRTPIELPVDTVEMIRALQRGRQDKTADAVVADAVELLRASIFDTPKHGRGRRAS